MEKSENNSWQGIDRYLLLYDSLLKILFNVIKGINSDNPIHMGLGYSLLIVDTEIRIRISLHDVRSYSKNYEIVDCNSDVSGIHLQLKHTGCRDIFEPGEFICSCRSGYFHFVCDFNGAFKEIIADFHGDTPSFISELVENFPNGNFRPDDVLASEFEDSRPVADTTFLKGLDPAPPIPLEID